MGFVVHITLLMVVVAAVLLKLESLYIAVICILYCHYEKHSMLSKNIVLKSSSSSSLSKSSIFPLNCIIFLYVYDARKHNRFPFSTCSYALLFGCCEWWGKHTFPVFKFTAAGLQRAAAYFFIPLFSTYSCCTSSSKVISII